MTDASIALLRQPVPPGIAATPAERRRPPPPAVATPEPDDGLRRLRRLGVAVLLAQAAALVAFSVVQYDRFSLTFDYGIYDQAFTLIAHGHLDPYDTLSGFAFWQNHGELLLWPLAPLWWLWPHGPVLQILQDLAVVGAEWVVLAWVSEVAVVSGRPSGPVARAAVGTTLVLLVADPWLAWSVAWDFHLEMVGLVFVMLALRSLWRGHDGRLWWWVALSLVCGDVVTTYLLAAAVGAAAVAWRGANAAGDVRDRRGLRVAAVCIGWSAVLLVLHANDGSALTGGYGYLAVGAAVAPPGLTATQLVLGALAHPWRILGALWARRLDLYAGLAPTGLLGVRWLPVAPVLLLVLLENGLYHFLGFAVPGFQDAPLFLFGALGTGAVLVAWARAHPRRSGVVAVVVAVNAVAWGAVWLPRLPSQWIRVSPAAAGELTGAAAAVPTGAEVIASQGVDGRFAGRRYDYAVMGPGRIPVRTRPVWVVLTASQGIETAPVDSTDALVQELAGPLGATLVDHGAGVWVFRWVPPPATAWLDVPARPTAFGGWVATGAAGRPVVAGPASGWVATGTGAAGYVVAGDYWREPPGRYDATVTLSSGGPVNVEVWDATGDVLLGRRTVPGGQGTVTVAQTVDATHVYGQPVYGGAGIMRIDPLPAPPGDELEIRVWTSGGQPVTVGGLSLAPAPSPTTAGR